MVWVGSVDGWMLDINNIIGYTVHVHKRMRREDVI